MASSAYAFEHSAEQCEKVSADVRYSPIARYVLMETMDLGLALQAGSLRYIAERYKELPHEPQPVPREINIDVARSMVEVLSRG